MSNNNEWSAWEALGKRWLDGEVDIEDFNGVKLNAKQLDFVNSKERYTLVCGGFAWYKEV